MEKNKNNINQHDRCYVDVVKTTQTAQMLEYLDFALNRLDDDLLNSKNELKKMIWFEKRVLIEKFYNMISSGEKFNFMDVDDSNGYYDNIYCVVSDLNKHLLEN